MPILFDVLLRILNMIALVASVPNQCFGQLVLTSGVSTWIEGDPVLISFVEMSLRRFYRNDWGDVKYQEDRDSNEEAIREMDGGRVLAVYQIPATLPQPSYDDRIWICCDAIGTKHALTTVLLPSEY